MAYGNKSGYKKSSYRRPVKKRSYGGASATRKKSYKKTSKSVTASKLLLSGSRLVDMEIRKNSRLDIVAVRPLMPFGTNADGSVIPPVVTDPSVTPAPDDLVESQIFEPIQWHAQGVAVTAGDSLGAGTDFRGRKGWFQSLHIKGTLMYKMSGSGSAGTADAVRYRIMVFTVKQAMTPKDIAIMADLDREMTSSRDMTVVPKVVWKSEGVLNDSKDIVQINHTCNVGRYMSRRQNGTLDEMGNHDGQTGGGLVKSVTHTERLYWFITTDARTDATGPVVHFKGFTDALGCELSRTPSAFSIVCVLPSLLAACRRYRCLKIGAGVCVQTKMNWMFLNLSLRSPLRRLRPGLTPLIPMTMMGSLSRRGLALSVSGARCSVGTLA